MTRFVSHVDRVLNYYQDTGFYDVEDADDGKRYSLPESQVLVMDLPDSSRKLSKGETIFAVYPDTTSFYHATVSQVHREILYENNSIAGTSSWSYGSRAYSYCAVYWRCG